jgi:hypothetical protein
MNITWKMYDCNFRTEDGFIVTAHWRATATDGEYAADNYSTCTFSGSVINIPYEDVTEQDVLNWCWSNGVNKEDIENNLVAQIEQKKHPVISNGLPWQNNNQEA